MPITEHAMRDVLYILGPNREHEPIDVDSRRHISCRINIDGVSIPIITRQSGQYCCSKSAQELLEKYLIRLHPSMYAHIKLETAQITTTEAMLIGASTAKNNDILCHFHCVPPYKDILIKFRDIQNFFTFISMCYAQVTNHNYEKPKRCGLLLNLSTQTVVPYILKGEEKYVPLSFLNIEAPESEVLPVNRWDSEYMTFCCKIVGMNKDLYPTGECRCVSDEFINTHFTGENAYVDFWPDKRIYINVLLPTNNHFATGIGGGENGTRLLRSRAPPRDDDDDIIIGEVAGPAPCPGSGLYHYSDFLHSITRPDLEPEVRARIRYEPAYYPRLDAYLASYVRAFEGSRYNQHSHEIDDELSEDSDSETDEPPVLWLGPARALPYAEPFPEEHLVFGGAARMNKQQSVEMKIGEEEKENETNDEPSGKKD